MTLELRDGSRLELPPAGLSFSFQWHPPDAQGIKALRLTLKDLLAAPHPHRSAYFLDALLKADQVGGKMTAQDLLTALDLRSGKEPNVQYDRSNIVRAVFTWHQGDPAVAAYYLRCLKEGDTAAMIDLLQPMAMWDKRFIAPMIEMLEEHGNLRILEILARHRPDWPDPEKTAQRLSAALLDRYPVLTEHPSDLSLDQLRGWIAPARALGLAGDQAMIRRLKPFLDADETLYDPRRISVPFGYRGFDVRACDTALEAILTLLGEDVDKAYPDASRSFPGRWEALMDVRDRMIKDLKKRLNAREAPNPSR